MDDLVYVPWRRLHCAPQGPAAVYRGRVTQVGDRSIKIELPGGAESDWVATAHALADASTLVVRIGDFHSEAVLLEPLAKCVLQYLRLLLSDDCIRTIQVRSLAELEVFWEANHAAFSYVVLIGHGSPNSITFGVDGGCDGAALANAFAKSTVTPKTFISLCCQTGVRAFSQPFSRSPVCRVIIAPFHEVHGAVASQFTQSLFAFHLLKGETPAVAFRHAREAVPDSTKFRMWKDGKLK